MKTGSKKRLDRLNNWWYNKKKEKEKEKMALREIWYMNTETGEITQDHREAVEWYRNKIEVSLTYYSEERQKWCECGYWAWD